MKIKLLNPISSSETKVLKYAIGVSAGFPSPADDYIEGSIDLNKELIKNAPATFITQVIGDSMNDKGIHPNDLLIVDKSEEAKSGDF